MGIARWDTMMALGAVLCTWAAAILAQERARVLRPAVWEWDALSVKRTDSGAIRDVVRQHTATLDELEMHVTTLNPGLSSHAPHAHPNEELVIIREGTVEVLSDGTWRRVGPGSIVFNAANAPHALRNAGRIQATYHVINWSTRATSAD